ncbi:MAG TPA: chemotaxis protein CheD [Verrucomicrobia bacterium]|nr:chemotaxis protein CheD [Verrucomicrobiota bacterium]
MNQIIIDIADGRVSNDVNDVLVTYSLGSCVGVAIYDPGVHVGGILHCMLPLANVDPRKAEDKPFMFVDSGMMKFLGMLFDLGLSRSRAIVKVAGCARILDNSNLFRIGERNHTVLRKILWKNGLMIKAEEVGGALSRTLRLEIGTGRCTLRSSGVESEF